jgi:hypothetical protein
MLVAALCVATGCGGSSEEDRARDVVETHMDAVSDQDAEQLCETIPPETFEGGKSCVQTMDEAWDADGPTEEVSEAIDDGAVTSVQLDGDEGTVATNLTKEPFTVVKVDGEWYVFPVDAS